MTRTAALLIAALLPHAGAAIELSGRVGLDYNRDDIWPYQSERLSIPRLDLSLGFDARGALGRPDIAIYGAGVTYERLTWDLPEGKRQEDRLGYRGNLSLFNGPRNPLRVTLSAARSDDAIDFGDVVGDLSTTSTVWSASSRLALPDRPAVALSYTNLSVERTGGLIPDSDRAIQTLSGSIVEGTGIFSYSAQYSGNFSEGTYATDHYDDHRVDATARAELGPKWSVTLADGFYRRLPTLAALANAEQEFNTFSAQVLNRESGDFNQSVNYRYTHGLQGSTGAGQIERTHQRLEYGVQRTFADPTWRIQGTADLSHVENRLGASDSKYTGEAAGALLYWRPKREGQFLELRGGPTFGLVHPDGEDPLFGFGLLAGVAHERRLAPATVRGAYTIGFQNDLREEGQSLSQNIQLTANVPVRGGSVNANLMAQSARLEGPILGIRSSRTIYATATYRWSSYTAGLQGSLGDSVNPSLDEGFIGDLLLAAPYDTHSRQLGINGSASFTRRARIHGILLLSSTELPDRPTVAGVEARAGFEFDLGALRLSVEDRYVIADVSGETNRVNQFMVRLHRLFGASY